jgi:phosphatidylserine/phosphatidylglycerophosphate/cardiolipin synthase-like enzyme
MALASANRSFQMVVPFFNSPLLVKHLIRTARRFKKEGRDPSKIRIVITGNATQPGTSDFFTNHYAFLLQREGISVEAWKPSRPGEKYSETAVHHAKSWIVDNKIAYLGSANANVRSLVQDWEVGVLTDEKSFVKDVSKKIFDADRKYCEPVMIRPAWQRRIGHAINILMGPVLRFL